MDCKSNQPPSKPLHFAVSWAIYFVFYACYSIFGLFLLLTQSQAGLIDIVYASVIFLSNMALYTYVFKKYYWPKKCYACLLVILVFSNMTYVLMTDIDLSVNKTRMMVMVQWAYHGYLPCHCIMHLATESS